MSDEIDDVDDPGGPGDVEEDQKAIVLLDLFKKYKARRFVDGIVLNSDIVESIRETDAGISQHNPANFLKDLIRSAKINDRWPPELKQERITARQRYGRNGSFSSKVTLPTRPYPSQTGSFHPIRRRRTRCSQPRFHILRASSDAERKLGSRR